MPGIITSHLRTHNAIQFYESFSEAAPTRYFYYIAKPDPYANTFQLTGTVKLSTGSNTVTGQGTLFTTELEVGDIVGVTGQANTLRVHSITNAQTFVSVFKPTSNEVLGANAYLRTLVSDFSPPQPEDSYQETYYESWRNMIALKKVQQSDVSHCIPRYDWANNTFYYAYDNLDPLQSVSLPIDTVFLTINDSNTNHLKTYTITDAGNVYKCIDNNRGANSTVKPTGTSTSIISTADGYRWKYLYTVTLAEALKFQTQSFIPVKTLTANDGSAQWNVQQAAANGAINKIAVIANGSGYLSTQNVFAVVTNSTSMILGDNAIAIDGVYNYSGLFIDSGVGSGQIRKILKYDGLTRRVTVNNAFTVIPNTSSTYIVSPTVIINGDSGATPVSRATAYVSNCHLGQVRKITMINNGRSYSYANAHILANSSYGTGATARIIISPQGGHGSDPVSELNAKQVIINVRVAGGEGNSFPTNNDFRTIGLIRDPLLANGTAANASVIDQSTRINLSLVSGDFIADEIVTGTTTGAKARVVYFANSNASRTQGILKVIKVIPNGIGVGFRVGETLSGLTSTVTANVQSVTKPALRPFTGLVMYTENRAPIKRAADQTEDVKFVITF